MESIGIDSNRPERVFGPLRFVSVSEGFDRFERISDHFRNHIRTTRIRNHRLRSEFTRLDDPIVRLRAVTFRPVEVAVTGCVKGGVNPPLWLGS